MQALGTAKGYGDWLFVFGTAVAAIDQEVTFCTTCGYGNSTIRFDRDPLNRAKTIAKCSRDTGLGPAHVIDTGSVGAEVQNVALIQHGGDTHLVAKEYVSGIDYIGGEVTVHPGQAGEMSLPVKPPEGSHDGGIRSKFDDERMGGCVLTVDGLTIGLEVCLDHNESLTPGLGRAYPFSGAIQILLIPSFGMDIGTGLYCRHGGVVFNVDGRGQGSSELVVKGRLTGIRCWKAGVAGGRGGLDIWSPQAIPR
jgi:hypothetical protein